VAQTADDQTADQLRREVAERRHALGRDLDALGAKVSPGQAVERRARAVRRGAGDVRDRVMGTAGGTVDGAREAIARTPERARRQVEGRPLTAGLVAFGAGVLAAAVLPPTRREQELAGAAQPAVASAASQVRDAGRETVEELREPARDAVAEVAGSAQEAAGRIAERGHQ
jgi:hypothetical protein